MANKLSEENLYDCLKSLSVPLRKQDVNVPTREFILRVFECFLKDMQVEITSPTLRPWNATRHMQLGPEIYEDAISLILIVRSINYFCDPIGMKITIRDITEPKPKRTKKILNYLIVFWNFYLKRYAQFRTTEALMEEEKKQIDDLVAHMEEIDKRFLEITSMLENMQISADELSSCYDVKQEKIEKFKEKKASVTAEYEGLKVEEVELCHEISATSVDIASAKEKLVELSQLILSSPDRFKSEIQRLQENVKSKELKVKSKEKDLKDYESKFVEAEKTQENYTKALTVLQEINKELQQLCKQVQDYSSGMEKLSEEEEIVKKLESDVERKSDLKAFREQKSAMMVLNKAKHTQALNETLEKQEREIEKEKIKLQSLNEKKQELIQCINSKKEELLLLKEKHKISEGETKEKIAYFRTKIAKLQAEFSAEIDEITKMIKRKL